MHLASDDEVTLDLRLDGSSVWSEAGDFKVARDEVTVTWLFDDDMRGDYEGAFQHETFDYRHDLLVLPTDGDVFVRLG